MLFLLKIDYHQQQHNNNMQNQSNFNYNQADHDKLTNDLFGNSVNHIKWGFETKSYMEALALTDFCFIKQKVELFEVITGCETKNRYNIFIRNYDGSFLYLFKVKENSNFCVRFCCR